MPAARAQDAPRTITYVVESSKYGEFPLDMLRKDEAQAASPEDQALIDRLCAFGEGKQDLPKIIRVRLTMTASRFGGPNWARWESFGYRVVECDDPTIQISPPTWKAKGGNPATLRKNVLEDLAEAVKPLVGFAYMAAATYDALRYGAEMAADEEQANRDEAVGFCIGVSRAFTTNGAQIMQDGSDRDAFVPALELARNVLVTDGDRTLQLCNGLQPKQALDKLAALTRRIACG